MIKPGDQIKVSRFAERLWLDVLVVHPGDTYVCKLANHPICWGKTDGLDVDLAPMGYGQVVVIGGAEVMEVVPAKTSKPSLTVVGGTNAP